MTVNPQQRFSADMGKVILFVANEAIHMDAGNLAAVARAVRPLGVDTLCVKRADGDNRWYPNPAVLEAEYKAVAAAGCGYVPMIYTYGPRFSWNQIDHEVAIILEMTDAIAQARGGEGFVVDDKEVEWNGQAAAAAHYAAQINGKPGLLGLTTWADPDQQDWDLVISNLLPVVNGWVPQAYNNWLASAIGQDIQHKELNIEPAIDLSQEFGANNQTAIAQQARERGESSIWLWDYTLTGSQRHLVQTLASIMKRG